MPAVFLSVHQGTILTILMCKGNEQVAHECNHRRVLKSEGKKADRKRRQKVVKFLFQIARYLWATVKVIIVPVTDLQLLRSMPTTKLEKVLEEKAFEVLCYSPCLGRMPGHMNFTCWNWRSLSKVIGDGSNQPSFQLQMLHWLSAPNDVVNPAAKKTSRHRYTTLPILDARKCKEYYH